MWFAHYCHNSNSTCSSNWLYLQDRNESVFILIWDSRDDINNFRCSTELIFFRDFSFELNQYEMIMLQTNKWITFVKLIFSFFSYAYINPDTISDIVLSTADGSSNYILPGLFY